MKNQLRFRCHCVGIPTASHSERETYLPAHKLFHWGFETSIYGIEWMRYKEGCTLSEIVKKVPHVAFEVDDLDEALRGKKVIIAPNSPSEGVRVAFIEEDGAPIEPIQLGVGTPKRSF